MSYGKLGLGIVLTAALVVIALVTALQIYDSLLVQRAQEPLEADWLAFAPRIKADEARWKDDSLFAKVDGPDAARLVAGQPRGPGSEWVPSLPAALVTQLEKWGPLWTSHVDEVELSAVDLRWMSSLWTFGFWDVEGPAGPRADLPWFYEEHEFLKMHLVAEARLLEGLKSGRASGAGRDARELARLLLTTEDSMAMSAALKVLEVERQAFEEAVLRGQPVDTWTPISSTDQKALSQLLEISWVPFMVHAPAQLSKWEPQVGTCIGLGRGLLTARYYRSFLRDAFRGRYAILELALSKSPCRFTRLRKAWNSAEDPLLESLAPVACPLHPDTRAMRCWLDLAAVQMPFIRRDYAVRELSGDWLRDYRLGSK